MKKLSQTFTLALVAIGFSAQAATSWNFDWDDNIAFMPTNVVLFHKATGKELLMDTASYAQLRGLIGKEGSFKGEALADYLTNRASFRYSQDGKNGENYFLDDLKRAIAESPDTWQGPVWKDFVFALSQPETARRTTIITARGHSRAYMMDALRYLQSLGYIRHLPLEENLFPVSHPDVSKHYTKPGDAANPSAIKAEIMTGLVDRLSGLSLDADEKPVLDSNGAIQTRSHLWGFSDDDMGNFQKAVDVLSREVAQGRWKNVKITLFFTGRHGPGPAGAKVIREDGSLRDQTAEEATEAFR